MIWLWDWTSNFSAPSFLDLATLSCSFKSIKFTISFLSLYRNNACSLKAIRKYRKPIRNYLQSYHSEITQRDTVIMTKALATNILPTFECLRPVGTSQLIFRSRNHDPKLIINESEFGQISAPDNMLFLKLSWPRRALHSEVLVKAGVLATNSLIHSEANYVWWILLATLEVNIIVYKGPDWESNLDLLVHRSTLNYWTISSQVVVTTFLLLWIALLWTFMCILFRYSFYFSQVYT